MNLAVYLEEKNLTTANLNLSLGGGVDLNLQLWSEVHSLPDAPPRFLCFCMKMYCMSKENQTSKVIS